MTAPVRRRSHVSERIGHEAPKMQIGGDAKFIRQGGEPGLTIVPARLDRRQRAR